MGMKLHPTHWFPAELDGACAGCGVHWVNGAMAAARPCRTPHPRVAEWITSGFTVITLRREPPGTKGGRWTYSWQPASDLPFPGAQPDGVARPGRWTRYGPGAGKLRAMLRRQYGKDVVFIEEWLWEDSRGQ